MTYRKILDVRNIQWTCPDQNAAFCEVLFEGESEYLPYNAVHGDSVEAGSELFQIIHFGATGEVPAYSGPTRALMDEWNEKITTKNALQKQFDAILPDIQIGLASDETMDKARKLRTQIVALDAWHKENYEAVFCYVKQGGV